ncbi:SulP family inorganic anion transporter [Mycolicibacterium brumae]|uniref:Carbonic anhydrase n=1 Tax=Mycolicibacterium brumae TaxID=85968 RepID=A0A2G5P5G3_9MYCO|nr:bifunctional SulP family inorganic anion transporter/carbonic anhydrase [Mycolicibacterium brumae]MCV7193435.1 bifunctional SulP family inorganic anion transporter/carbonic anhydrase [Mycolicibacterium brumae]PIB73144.1 carbonic anhydrase [Mycolicibacterium brumae]RWA17137.1 hypothetical protein MBRU_05800 [Mycolicibacterium brumae DSM 44177]UWW09292.1 bifunctional SulP family inorganic anion transporter/carbonic anhydrase [Mycolicibacterium brumae]
MSEILRHDVPASLVVFLVALPLSLGIAYACGAPLMAGLIAAIVGGVVAGVLGGAPMQVTGPAAGLVVVVAGLIDQFGWAMTCVITIGAGVLQIVFGLTRVARGALAVAPVVVHAMLAGIGVTIALQQLHVLLGGSPKTSAWQNIRTLPDDISALRWPELAIGVLVIAVLLLWPKLPPRLRVIPGPMVAIVAATVAALALHLSVQRVSLSGSLLDAIGLPALPATAPDGAPWRTEYGAIALGMLTVALIASVESLLSAVGVDKLHTGPRTDLDRELIGQGGANMVSGALGGLPVTGVIIRGSANVAAGAITRGSAILHGVWILLFAVVAPGLIELVPTAALAGLLIVIGMQLVKLAHMRLARRTGDFVVYLATMLGVVFLNLLEGVAIGLGISIALLLWRVMRAQMRVRPAGVGAADWEVELDGTLSFLSLPRLSKQLAEIPPDARVTLTMNADYIDHAISEAIADFKRAHEATGGTVMVIESTHAKLHHAHAAPPQRHFMSRALGFAPWRSWLPWEGYDGGSVLDGIGEYNQRAAAALHPLIRDPSAIKDPDALFLTCTDSRVMPNVITASGPGDLFTVRNVGNLVAVDDESLSAALDFAVRTLGVSSLVVCGHSSCGAMNELLSLSEDSGTPMSHWLAHGRDSLDAYRGGHPGQLDAAARGFAAPDQLGVVNVAVQVRRLRSHPLLAESVAQGRIEVLGVYFDVATAHVYEVDADGITEDRLPSPARSRAATEDR